MAGPERPTTYDGMRSLLDRMWTDELYEEAKRFVPRPSDVFVMTYPKCGTTWTQQIVHGLRTNGSMDFEEISSVVPWVETAATMGIDLEAEQAARPRAFKTHFNWHDVPKGARYIIVVRDPYDTLLSRFKFFEGMFFERGTVTLEEFARRDFIGSRRYWDHLESWWGLRNEPYILPLAYEDMAAAPRDAVERIARFMGISASPDLIELATHQSSFAFMKAHERQFDDHVLSDIWVQRGVLPEGGEFTKVHTGKSGNTEVSFEVRAELDALWDEIVAPLGIRDYADLRRQLRD